MNKHFSIGALTLSLFFSLPGLAQAADCQPEKHAESQIEHPMHASHSGHADHASHHASHQVPIGVMGAHMHKKGHSMVSLRMMYQDMQGLLNGSQQISEMDAMSEFHILPRSMKMFMPMFGAMYAPRDDLTLMLMLPGQWMHMEHIHHNESMLMSAQGLGDLNLSALFGNWQWQTHQLHLNLRLSIPTGAIDITDKQQVLPYPMRLGSGTWDILPGLTYNGSFESLSWGTQAQTTLRLGENALSYRLGHRFQTQAWGAWQILPWLQSTLRLQYQAWGNVEGEDRRLTQAKQTQPIADPLRQAGQRLELFGGLSLNGTESLFPGQRLGLEVGLPLFQSLAGPQLATQWSAILGWEWQF